jgi:hypothetical protein
MNKWLSAEETIRGEVAISVVKMRWSHLRLRCLMTGFAD